MKHIHGWGLTEAKSFIEEEEIGETGRFVKEKYGTDRWYRCYTCGAEKLETEYKAEKTVDRGFARV